MPALENEECWYALRTFHAQEFKVSHYLEQCHLGHFIPMSNRVRHTEEGALIKTRQPAVHNLIFLQKTRPKAELRTILSECPYAVSVYHHIDNEEKWYEISSHEILELRLLCDHSFNPQFISQEESELKVGSEVYVKHGPFKGLSGKLVRKNKKYYLVKSFVGLGVMVAVSRWCCESIEH